MPIFRELLFAYFWPINHVFQFIFSPRFLSAFVSSVIHFGGVLCRGTCRRLHHRRRNCIVFSTESRYKHSFSSTIRTSSSDGTVLRHQTLLRVLVPVCQFLPNPYNWHRCHLEHLHWAVYSCSPLIPPTAAIQFEPKDPYPILPVQCSDSFGLLIR